MATETKKVSELTRSDIGKEISYEGGRSGAISQINHLSHATILAFGTSSETVSEEGAYVTFVS